MEINGQKYVRLPEKKSKSFSPIIQEALMMEYAFSSIYIGQNTKRPRERPRVDIVKEFELIQQKKSKLSRSDRDWVVKVFNENFVKVK
jgi:hypothetical protein